MNENKPDEDTPNTTIIDATPMDAEPTDTASVDAEPMDEAQSAPKAEDDVEPAKKSRLKLHLILILVLGFATWAFWTWAPQGQQLKAKIETLPWFAHVKISPAPATSTLKQSVIKENPEEITKEDIAQTSEEIPEEALDDVAEEEAFATPIEDTPLLEAKPDMIPVAAPVDTSNEEAITALTNLVAQLHNQMVFLQENISQMYDQQTEHNQQQVKAEVFTALQKAASPNNAIEDTASAWKSISLLPMLDDSRRAEAKQAWHELNGLSNDTQLLSQEIISSILSLADKLHPDDLVDVADTVENLVDSYANTNNNTWMTWLDWLQKQYRFTKVSSHAFVMSDDPYADIKQLINQLNQLKDTLVSGQWQTLPDVDTIIHQLDQRGISTTFSSEMIQQMQQTQQAWQTKAKAWMEQL